MRTLAIVLGLAFAVIAIVSMVLPRRSPPSYFSPSRGTPGDPAREGTIDAVGERHSAFHGMMTRSSSLSVSVIRKPMIAITNRPTYICSTANVLQALQIR
jgi:hypothetical protein